MNLAKNRTIFSIAILLIIAIIALVAIFWARGFKPNFRNGTIQRTGLIVANSLPTGAQVFIDDRLTSATNTSIAFLEPKTYKVKIEKDGYTTWQKDITVQADLATEINALLFPLAPQISPLTTTGATNPTLSPDSAKIIYGVSGVNGGVYILPMTDNIFAFRQGTRLIAKNTASFDFSNAQFNWGPDSKQVIARFKTADGTVTANLMLDSDVSNQPLRDVTASLGATISDWQEQINARAQTLAVLAPDEVKGATEEATQASPSPVASTQSTVNGKNISVNREPTTDNLINYYPTGLIFSPDEEKVLYTDKNGKHHVYDLKNKKQYTMPDFTNLINITWFPDSAHLVVAQKDQISIIESDGNNKMGIYSGKFEYGFAFAHPSGSKLVILTTLTQPEGTPSNLYAINLK
ncbi:TPA: hypothetical protein DIV55_06495 [Patescibacteria group bacterium]|nr:hypothetical protein [Patescibacteria group bacterium]